METYEDWLSEDDNDEESDASKLEVFIDMYKDIKRFAIQMREERQRVVNEIQEVAAGEAFNLINLFPPEEEV
jgi:SMC interacting uncharacterized protein involved in chromosome segregation